MTFTFRLIIAVLLLAAIHFAVRLTRAGGRPTKAELPKPDLRSLPLQLGEWTGKGAELDPARAAAAGAEYVVNRQYSNSAGDIVQLHIAVITDYGKNGLRHFPKYCHRGAGYDLRQMQSRPLKLGGNHEIPVCYSSWSRDDDSLSLAYWYQFGDDVILDINEFRAACRQRWGSHDWPPVVKVMLSSAGDRSNQIPPYLDEFGRLVANWTCKVSHER